MIQIYNWVHFERLNKHDSMETRSKFLTLLYFAFCSCSFSSLHEVETLRCYKVTNLFPKFNNNGEVLTYDTSFAKVYFYGKYRLYDLSYIIKIDNEEQGEVFKKRRHFVVFNKDSLYGLDYDEFKIPTKRKVLLDSLFRTEWIAQNKIYPIIRANITTLISKNDNKETKEVIEKFSLKSKEDSSLIGQLSLVFKREFTPQIDISLSKELDSIRRMKLIKTEIKAFARDFKQYKTHIGEYVTGNELIEIPVDDREKILSYFLK